MIEIEGRLINLNNVEYVEFGFNYWYYITLYLVSKKTLELKFLVKEKFDEILNKIKAGN